MNPEKLALLTDLYEFTMANAFYQELPKEEGVFDIFFRNLPDNGSRGETSGRSRWKIPLVC